jgi:hypothetical protein
MGSIGGLASGDFRLSQGALRILYHIAKDNIPVLASDGFTQNNPNVVVNPLAVSTTLPTNVKRGALGGSVAFTRPDVGSNTVGGAVLVNAAYVVNTRPLGLFINDALGNSFENTPGVASGKGPFVRGGAAGIKIYETQQQTLVGGGAVGDPLAAYGNGQKLYASVNGYLTNRWQDSYEAQWLTAAVLGSGGGGVAIEPDVTCMGIVLSPPDATSAELFAELKY